MPLLGDCTVPSGFFLGPARYPTAASTRPPGWPKVSLPCTTTSVTTLAKKQPFLVSERPAQSPVGSDTCVKLRPASVERNRPRPVAAHTMSELVGSTAALKPSAPSGTPSERVHVLPRSSDQK